MTTEHEETEKLRACPFCGKKVVYVDNGNGILDAWCSGPCDYYIPAVDFEAGAVWKLLDEKDEKIIGLEKELTLSRSAVRRLREALEKK